MEVSLPSGKELQGGDMAKDFEAFDVDKGLGYMDEVFDLKHGLVKMLGGEEHLDEHGRLKKESFSYKNFWQQAIASGICLSLVVKDHLVHFADNSHELLLEDPALLQRQKQKQKEPLEREMSVKSTTEATMEESPILTRRAFPPQESPQEDRGQVSLASSKAVSPQRKQSFYPVFSNGIFSCLMEALEAGTSGIDESGGATSGQFHKLAFTLNFFMARHISLAVLDRIHSDNSIKREHEYQCSTDQPPIRFVFAEKGQYLLHLYEDLALPSTEARMSQEKGLELPSSEKDIASELIHRYLIRIEQNKVYMVEFPYDL